MLLNPIGDKLGIAQTVRMMRHAILNHHGDAPAKLLITIFNRQRVALEQEVRAAAYIQQRDIVLRQLA
jgi:hypothetical protein